MSFSMLDCGSQCFLVVKISHIGFDHCLSFYFVPLYHSLCDKNITERADSGFKSNLVKLYTDN